LSMSDTGINTNDAPLPWTDDETPTAVETSEAEELTEPDTESAADTSEP